MERLTKEDLITFEKGIAALWDAGELPCLLHLCGGNEDQLLSIFETYQEGDWVFSSHRNHYHALLAGIPPWELRKSIWEGHSMFTFSKARRFFSSAILAGSCGIAAGVAWSLKQQKSTNKVFCFLGDGAEEQGHFYEAALFVEANDLPCKFIVEDNGMQVDTPKKVRRGIRFRPNRPLDDFRCVTRYEYVRTHPHAGTGTKPTFTPEAIARLKP